jgi:hypothetical protein
MRFKKNNDRGSIGSYQCYVVNRDGSTTRIARIDEPWEEKNKGFARFWSVYFVGKHIDGNVGNLLKITNKIKKLAKGYYDER